MHALAQHHDVERSLLRLSTEIGTFTACFVSRSRAAVGAPCSFELGVEGVLAMGAELSRSAESAARLADEGEDVVIVAPVEHVEAAFPDAPDDGDGFVVTLRLARDGLLQLELEPGELPEVGDPLALRVRRDRVRVYASF
ncbi:MAG: hypothetical protein U0353_34795 [Sandaracinus sp.]